jgi:hypothetical protein
MIVLLTIANVLCVGVITTLRLKKDWAHFEKRTRIAFIAAIAGCVVFGVGADRARTFLLFTYGCKNCPANFPPQTVWVEARRG